MRIPHTWVVRLYTMRLCLDCRRHLLDYHLGSSPLPLILLLLRDKFLDPGDCLAAYLAGDSDPIPFSNIKRPIN